MTAKETRQKILQIIDRRQADSPNYISDSVIADEMKIGLEDVRGHLGILEDEDRLKVTRTNKGHSGYLLPKQRQRHREALAEQQVEKEMRVTAFDLHNPSMIRTLTGMVMVAGNIDWQLFATTPAEQCEGVRVQFPLAGRMERRRALQRIGAD